jgi:hypothetical protein
MRNSLSAALIALSAAPALAQPSGEWLAARDRETLEVIESSRTEFKTKTVYVGRGETPETWTRRIMIWSYPGYVLDRAAFAEQTADIRRATIADCPGVRASALRPFDWSGRAAADYVIVCPFYPETGRQDIYLVRSIAGATGFLAAAVTFRHPPTEAEAEQARTYLDTLVLCTPARDEPACRD